MLKLRLLTPALLLSLSTFAQTEDDVVINEFVVNPTTGKEYIELLVITDNLDMQGWTLSDVVSRAGGTDAAEGDFTLPASAAYLASVPIGTYIVLELSTPALNASTLAEDIEAGDKKMILKAGTSGVSIAGTPDIGTSENFQLYAGTRAAGTLIDQVLSGSNTSYIAGSTWGDNSTITSVDNINAGLAVTSGSAILFVPAPQLSANDFKNNDTGTKYVSQAASYGTPGAANTGVDDAPLPVSLLSFRAQRTKNKVSLSWSTASEINNDHFSIERSADGLHFSSIGVIPGAGQSSVIRSYSFTDEHPANSNSYYRLKQIDFNGTARLSDVVLVKAAVKQLSVTYAALKEDNLNMTIYSPQEGNAVLQVFDIRGSLIAETTIRLDEGSNIARLENPGISGGIHVLRISMEKESFRQSFLF